MNCFLGRFFALVSTSCLVLQGIASSFCRTSNLPCCGGDGGSPCIGGARSADAESLSVTVTDGAVGVSGGVTCRAAGRESGTSRSSFLVDS